MLWNPTRGAGTPPNRAVKGDCQGEVMAFSEGQRRCQALASSPEGLRQCGNCHVVTLLPLYGVRTSADNPGLLCLAPQRAFCLGSMSHHVEGWHSVTLHRKQPSLSLLSLLLPSLPVSSLPPFTCHPLHACSTCQVFPVTCLETVAFTAGLCRSDLCVSCPLMSVLRTARHPAAPARGSTPWVLARVLKQAYCRPTEHQALQKHLRFLRFGHSVHA